MLRLQKFLAQAGLGSRRSCEQLIKENKIFVNGEIASLGTKVSETDEVIFDNQKVVLKTADLKIIMLNKPPGVLSSKKDEKKIKLVFDFLPKVRYFKQNPQTPCVNTNLATSRRPSPMVFFSNFWPSRGLWTVRRGDKNFNRSLGAHTHRSRCGRRRHRRQSDPCDIKDDTETIHCNVSLVAELPCLLRDAWLRRFECDYVAPAQNWRASIDDDSTTNDAVRWKILQVKDSERHGKVA